MKKEELKEKLIEAGATDTESMITALCDGELLEQIGITDDDQEVVESLHADLKEKEKIVIAIEKMQGNPGFETPFYIGWQYEIDDYKQSFKSECDSDDDICVGEYYIEESKLKKILY